MVHVTAFFAGLLAFIFIGLSFVVIGDRYKFKLALGDGGQASMMRKIRAHANFAEYVPMALILMGLNELNGSSKGWLIFLGCALVAARLSHAYSMIVAEVKNEGNVRFRQIGVVTTFSVIVVLAFMAIV